MVKAVPVLVTGVDIAPKKKLILSWRRHVARTADFAGGVAAWNGKNPSCKPAQTSA